MNQVDTDLEHIDLKTSQFINEKEPKCIWKVMLDMHQEGEQTQQIKAY